MRVRVRVRVRVRGSTASSGTSRAAPAGCVEAAVAVGCAEEGGGAAEEAAVDDDRAAGEAAVVDGAECASAAAVVARALTAARFPSDPLAARMTTTGQSMTPSDASDASSSCRRLPSWQTWKSPAALGRPGWRQIRRRSSPRVAASSRVTVCGLPPSSRAASITRQDILCALESCLAWPGRAGLGWVACAELEGEKPQPVKAVKAR